MTPQQIHLAPMTSADLEAAYDIVLALADLDTSSSIDCWGEDVLALLDGQPHRVFKDLDESPGHWGYEVKGQEWHWKLRRVRNHETLGRRMFDALDTSPTKRPDTEDVEDLIDVMAAEQVFDISVQMWRPIASVRRSRVDRGTWLVAIKRTSLVLAIPADRVAGAFR